MSLTRQEVLSLLDQRDRQNLNEFMSRPEVRSILRAQAELDQTLIKLQTSVKEMESKIKKLSEKN